MNAPADLMKLAELRFFRDLIDAERMKVFKAFDLLPQDHDEQIPHAIQRKLFEQIASTRQAASVSQPEVQSEVVTTINARLTDLAEANALYGKDQRLSAPDKIARNEREISWLKDLRSMIALGAAQGVKDPILTPRHFLDDILSACDASNWDADRNKGDYYRGLNDAYEVILNIAVEYQTSIYAWCKREASPVPSASRGTEA